MNFRGLQEMNWRLALLYYVSKSGDLLQITQIEQWKFCICYSGRDSKMFQITSKYFRFYAIRFQQSKSWMKKNYFLRVTSVPIIALF